MPAIYSTDFCNAMVLDISKIISTKSKNPPEKIDIRNDIIPPYKIVSGKLSKGGFRPFLLEEVFPPLFLVIEAASLATL